MSLLSGENRRKLEQIIGYSFRKPAYLETALIHSSYRKQKEGAGEKCPLGDYERQEFLGDAVLELVTSEYLFDHYPGWTEGELTKERARIVCEASLSYIVKKNDIHRFMILSNGEEKTGGRVRPSILCDVFEAIAGGIYLDAGLEEARGYIRRMLLDHIEELPAEKSDNFKSKLQELLQGEGKGRPEYEVIREEGPTNNRTFTMRVLVEGKPVATAVGRSKKQAEQLAAEKALAKLQA